MSKWCAAILALSLMLPGKAVATADPTNDYQRERQVYLVMLDRYVGQSAICVMQKPDDFPHFTSRRGPLHRHTDWWYVDGVDNAERQMIDHDFFTLEETQLAPVVGHYIAPELLPVNMRLAAPEDSCGPKLTLSAPAFVGETAFIDLTYDCVLCGRGASYALRLRQGQWQVVAEWVHWES